MKYSATLIAVLMGFPLAAQQPPAPADYRARLPEDEIVYFMLPDRFENGDPANDHGGLKGDRLKTGYDPTAKGFYHGGDLKGLIKRLDYVQGMGATAIWVGPIFRNKPVQGLPGHESAGYHGYWITDFTTVDPHLGTDADFAALVAAAHARGMKVYMDIIVNHTADVIQYRECPEQGGCPYRSRADYPYQRKGGVAGRAINPGFAGDQAMSAANFAQLTDTDYAYQVYVPKSEVRAKTPAWLNDPILYHNRGDSTFKGENSTMGDFAGLDDLMTENPRVVQGMVDIFGAWIDRYGIDGYRIDTAKHVNPEFWQVFVRAIKARAAAKGIPNFHVFGEVMEAGIDPVLQAQNTRVAKLPSVLDFAFRSALVETVAGSAGTDRLERMFSSDSLYEGGSEAALRMPTFLGNHDLGRFAHGVQAGFPQASETEVLDRVLLGHAMLLGLRGVPVIYSGDEQGFTGDGGDQDAREDMFASRVASYNDNRLVGTARTTATDSFGTDHPVYREVAQLSKPRTETAALRRGRQLLRFASDKPGLFAVSRFDPQTGREYVIAFNTSTKPIEANLEVEVRSSHFMTLAGAGQIVDRAPASVMLALPPLGFAIAAAGVPND